MAPAKAQFPLLLKLGQWLSPDVMVKLQGLPVLVLLFPVSLV